MKDIFLIFLLTSAFCVEPMPNIGYLSYGYNVLKGNPHTTESGVDPGFTTQIFTVAYDTHKTTDDRRYLVPDNMSAIKEEATNAEFGTEQMSGTEKYSESISQEFGLSMEGWGAKFSMSVDYSKMQERTKTTRTVFSFSKGFVQVYRAQIGVGIPPRLSEDFVHMVDRLPDTYSEEPYMEMLDSFGTHYVTVIHMGARFATQSALSETSYKSLIKQGIKIKVAASASAFGITGMVDHRTEQEKQWAREYDQMKEHSSINTIGMRPLINKTAQEWLDKVIEEPMPMKYTLLPLNKLFNPNNFYRRYSNQKMEVLKKNVELALKNYCEFKKKQGLIRSCEKPITDPPFPDPLATCKFCFSCGEEFPIGGGSFNAEHGSTYLYGRNCHEPYNTEHYLPSLCCEKSDQKKLGNCRFCSNCGAEYPTRSGGLSDNTQTYYNFQRDCSGKLGFWGDKNVSLCCSTPEPACTVCETCGGRWPVGSGGMIKNHHSYQKANFEGRGRACEGDVRKLTDPEPKYLCCKTKETFVE